jgi:DNA-binding LytR/AlgR family response regulator
MLQVIIFDHDITTRTFLRRVISERSTKKASRIALFGDCGTITAAEDYISKADGQLLVFIGLNHNSDSALQLGRSVYAKNHDSFIVYLLESHADVQQLAESLVKISGIIIKPTSKEMLCRVLDKLEEEYQEIFESEQDEYLVLNSQGQTFRLALNRILYFEAIEKKVTIWTDKQSISVRVALGVIEGMLPEKRFVRCHRSYIVNIDKIDSVNFGRMELNLQNGDNVYIARSYKSTIKKLLGLKEDFDGI